MCHEHLQRDLICHVIPALAKETSLPWCSTLPAFSSQTVRADCKTRILALYISCVNNIWYVLDCHYDGIELSKLLGAGSMKKYECGAGENLHTLYDTLFMGAVVQCLINNEGYATLILYALAEHYERLYRRDTTRFYCLDGIRKLSAKQMALIEPLSTIANEAILIGNIGNSVHVRDVTGYKINFRNKLCYAFTLALYNILRDIDNSGESYIWDRMLFSGEAKQPTQPTAESFLNGLNRLRVGVMAALDNMNRRRFAIAKPMSSHRVRQMIEDEGFGKAVPANFRLSTSADVKINAFTKNKVVTVYMLCPNLKRISHFNEAYTRKASDNGRVTRRFVKHSNKISSGLGACTFSMYKIQDNTGMGSCINTFNFHTSGNYLELCISCAAVELDMMRVGVQGLVPTTMQMKVHQNTCTTVDLHGILNPETCRSHAKMVWDMGSTPTSGPMKTTRFPAYNIYVRYPNYTERPKPGMVDRGCVSRKRRAFAAFDDRGIVCEQQRYTLPEMKSMMNCSVSWELHKNNINTSFFYGVTLADRLRDVLTWYFERSGVEFDPNKQRFMASIEKKAGGLLPFSVSLLAELQYILDDKLIKDQLDVEGLFLSRSMICTYAGFSRGNPHAPMTSKSMYNHISTQHRLPETRNAFHMNMTVLRELAERDEVDMGQIKSQINACKAPLCGVRSRSDGLVSSLLYGPESFVRTFLEKVPVLDALQDTLTKRMARDGLRIVSLFKRNYGHREDVT